MDINLQNYIEEKCGVEDKLSWVHMIIGKGFLGKFWVILFIIFSIKCFIH